MAKKKGLIERVTETFMPGDREPGEEAPTDDSHVKGTSASIQGHMADPESEIVNFNRPAPEPEEKTEDELFDVEIAGTTRRVDQTTYDLVMAERASNIPDPDPDPIYEEPSSNFNAEDFYTDPEAALKAVEDRAVERAQNQQQANYAASKAQNDFWSAFYEENPKLSGEDRLVKMMLAENMPKLQSLSGKNGRDKLAEYAESEILRISNKHRGRPKAGNATTKLEGSSSSALTTADSDTQVLDAPPAERPPSIGDAIKQRKLNRDRARRGETQLS